MNKYKSSFHTVVADWLTLIQDKRLLKMVNKARALAELNSQASLLVPLALPEKPLPSTVHVDPSSAWHVSALFAAAVESTTLCTRLKPSAGLNSTNLGDFADLLNVYGRQTIANLEFEPTGPAGSQTENGAGAQSPGFLNGHGEIVPGAEGVDYDAYTRPEPEEDKAERLLGIDLSSPEELELNPRGRRRAKRHIFSQVQMCRGGEEVKPDSAQDRAAYVRQRRQKVHRFVFILKLLV